MLRASNDSPKRLRKACAGVGQGASGAMWSFHVRREQRRPVPRQTLRRRLGTWLGAPILLLSSGLLAGAAHAQVPAPPNEPEQAIVPRLERPEVVVPAIDTESVVINAFTGFYSTENFGTEPVFGLRAAYHFSEDFFVEASYGRTEIADSEFRRFGLALFDDEEEALGYYTLSLGYNVLPAEFFGASRAFTGGVYLIAGVGNTEFADEDYFTYNLGGGIRLLPNDWLVLSTDVRLHAFESSLLGEHEFTQHMEATANVGVFF